MSCLALRQKQKSVFPIGNFIPVNRCLWASMTHRRTSRGSLKDRVHLRSSQEAEQKCAVGKACSLSLSPVWVQMYKTIICILSGLSSPIEATICLTCRLSISVLWRQMLPSAQNLGHRWSCLFSVHMGTMQAARPLCSCLCVICNQSLSHVS